MVFQPASRFDETQRISLINALFSATHRLQNVSLHLTDFELRHFKLDQSVPQLRKLALVAPHDAHLGCFFRSLPALEDLHYGHIGTAGANTSTPPRLSSQLHDFPLPQLTRLSLWNIKCEMSDMLDVLQSAVNAVDIVMSNCTLHALQGSHHTQRILPNLVALDVHQSHTDFLSHLSTPALQLLSLTGPLSRLPPALVSFTTQARASLTSLKLSHISGYDTPLLALLRTVPHLTRLRLLNTRSTGIHTSFIEALTITPAVFPLPRLASLELEGRFWCGTHPLMTMLRSRCSPAGALRTVRLFGGSELADVRGQSLGDEVEFVVRAGTAS
ncbi:hypothetical protein B0H16DRAFT_1722182 [Mycena metata]|uniref:Uncharacterized protein n=1 Tax=Mycena metata TaxID=1033252 RepID=A0AAD7J5G0_9AGAR|nr:hypothetical protein B0H16DRAFT_1722182 [Mycena metata]